MSDRDLEVPSTRPYLVRALHQWCTDHGFTPYLQVQVGRGVRVPMEYVQDGTITLNISYDATQGLQLDNEGVAFKARFGGVAREVWVPMSAVLAIFARENGQGMAFELPDDGLDDDTLEALQPPAPDSGPGLRLAPQPPTDGDNPPPEPSPSGSRPALKRVK